MSLLRTTLAAFFLCFATGAAADTEAEARKAMEDFVAAVTTLETRFTQIQRDEYGDVLQESEGAFWLQRPGRFRWEVEAPFTQVLVADGETLWFYDPEIAQATRRPVQEALAGTPAALLAEGAELGDAYELSLLDVDGAESDAADVHLKLTPRDSQAEFRSLVLTLRDSVPQAIAFEDQLGGLTEVRFGELRVNQPIDRERLRFSPPSGTDVVDLE